MKPSLPDWKTIPGAERDRLLADFCSQGLSSQQIADKFQNCSRSAAIGKISRLKLRLNSGVPRSGNSRKAGVEASPKTAKPAKPKNAPAPKRTARTAEVVSWRGANNPHRNDLKARAAQRAASPGIVIRREDAFDPIPGSIPVAVGAGGCRWPVDGLNGLGLLACGGQSEPGRPYCAAHHRLSHQPATIRQRAAIRSAERML